MLEMPACTGCGLPPKLVLTDHTPSHYIFMCDGGCFDRNGHGWFSTWPWADKQDAINEWVSAVNTNNGIDQLTIFSI